MKTFDSKVSEILKTKQNILLISISSESKYDYCKNNILQDYDILYVDCTEKIDPGKIENIEKASHLKSMDGNKKIIFIDIIDKVRGKMIDNFINLIKRSGCLIIATANNDSKVSKRLLKFFRKVKFSVGEKLDKKENLFALINDIFFCEDRQKVRKMLNETSYSLPVLLFWLDANWFKAYDNYDLLNRINENLFKSSEKYIKDALVYGIERPSKKFSIGRY